MVDDDGSGQGRQPLPISRRPQDRWLAAGSSECGGEDRVAGRQRSFRVTRFARGDGIPEGLETDGRTRVSDGQANRCAGLDGSLRHLSRADEGDTRRDRASSAMAAAGRSNPVERGFVRGDISARGPQGATGRRAFQAERQVRRGQSRGGRAARSLRPQSRRPT